MSSRGMTPLAPRDENVSTPLSYNKHLSNARSTSKNNTPEVYLKASSPSRHTHKKKSPESSRYGRSTERAIERLKTEALELAVNEMRQAMTAGMRDLQEHMEDGLETLAGEVAQQQAAAMVNESTIKEALSRVELFEAEDKAASRLENVDFEARDTQHWEGEASARMRLEEDVAGMQGEHAARFASLESMVSALTRRLESSETEMKGRVEQAEAEAARRVEAVEAAVCEEFSVIANKVFDLEARVVASSASKSPMAKSHGSEPEQNKVSRKTSPKTSPKNKEIRRMLKQCLGSSSTPIGAQRERSAAWHYVNGPISTEGLSSSLHPADQGSQRSMPKPWAAHSELGQQIADTHDRLAATDARVAAIEAASVAHTSEIVDLRERCSSMDQGAIYEVAAPESWCLQRKAASLSPTPAALAAAEEGEAIESNLGATKEIMSSMNSTLRRLLQEGNAAEAASSLKPKGGKQGSKVADVAVGGWGLTAI